MTQSPTVSVGGIVAVGVTVAVAVIVPVGFRRPDNQRDEIAGDHHLAAVDTLQSQLPLNLTSHRYVGHGNRQAIGLSANGLRSCSQLIFPLPIDRVNGKMAAGAPVASAIPNRS